MSRSLAKRPRPRRSILYGSLVGIGTAVVGAILITQFTGQSSPYGLALFIAVPVATGLLTSHFAGPFSTVLLATFLSFGFCSFGLIFTGFEGMVCMLMATPLILVGAAIGATVGWLLRKFINSRTTLLFFLLIGLPAIFGAGRVEQSFFDPNRVEEISSTYVVQTSPDKAWESLIAVDQILGGKPFLLKIGLPVPMRCTLEGSGVGAKRTCHFDSGFIEEEIITWQPPNYVEMKIVRSTLPGRHWLSFETASYRIEPLTLNETRITRTTTIASKLRPAWYWTFFERMGIEAEHRYLFDTLFRS